MSDKQIIIACEVKDYLPVDAMYDLQDKLKSLSKDAYEQLRDEILNTGFAFPVHVWRDESLQKYFIVGGHQRVKVLRKMLEEGYTLPAGVPVVKIKAKDINEAKRRVLQDIAQYGKVESDEFVTFTKQAGLDLEEIAKSFVIPGINIPDLFKEFSTGDVFSDPGNLGGDSPSAGPTTGTGDMPVQGAEGIKMLQLFYKQSEYPQIAEMIETLTKHYGVANVSELFVKCMEDCIALVE